MSVTSALWASGTPTTAQSNGSWTGATNATGANNATFATWTSTGSGATGSIIAAGFGAQAAMGGSAPASVDSVAVTVYGYVTNTTRMASIAVQLTDNGTVFGTAQTMTKSTTTTNSQTFTFTGVTWAQLANLGVRVLFTRGAVTTAANGLVDAVRVTVTYTPPPTYQFYTDTVWSGSGTGAPSQGYVDVSCAVSNGDLLIAAGLSSNCNGGAGSVTTQSGSTSAWIELAENNVASSTGTEFSYAQATADGTVTARVTVPSTGGVTLQGSAVWVIPAGQWSGTPTIAVIGPHDADAKVNATLADTSWVFYAVADWGASDPGSSVTPAGGTVRDSYFGDGTQYGILTADWASQAAGTRAYGITSPAGTDWAGGVIIVPAVGGGPVTTYGIGVPI